MADSPFIPASEPPFTVMVSQYGFCDDDTDDDKSQKGKMKRDKKKKSAGGALSKLLRGPGSGVSSGLYKIGDSEDEDSERRDGDTTDEDSDEDSVCSSASNNSLVRAAQSLKKLGNKLKIGKSKTNNVVDDNIDGSLSDSESYEDNVDFEAPTGKQRNSAFFLDKNRRKSLSGVENSQSQHSASARPKREVTRNGGPKRSKSADETTLKHMRWPGNRNGSRKNSFHEESQPCSNILIADEEQKERSKQLQQNHLGSETSASTDQGVGRNNQGLGYGKENFGYDNEVLQSGNQELGSSDDNQGRQPKQRVKRRNSVTKYNLSEDQKQGQQQLQQEDEKANFDAQGYGSLDLVYRNLELDHRNQLQKEGEESESTTSTSLSACAPNTMEDDQVRGYTSGADHSYDRLGGEDEEDGDDSCKASYNPQAKYLLGGAHSNSAEPPVWAMNVTEDLYNSFSELGFIDNNKDDCNEDGKAEILPNSLLTQMSIPISTKTKLPTYADGRVII